MWMGPRPRSTSCFPVHRELPPSRWKRSYFLAQRFPSQSIEARADQRRNYGQGDGRLAYIRRPEARMNEIAQVKVVPVNLLDGPANAMMMAVNIGDPSSAESFVSE